MATYEDMKTDLKTDRKAPGHKMDFSRGPRSTRCPERAIRAHGSERTGVNNNEKKNEVIGLGYVGRQVGMERVR